MRSDCLVHVFWGVLEDSYRHFSNPLSPEAARARYIDLKSFRLLGTRLGHMAEKLACNKPMNECVIPKTVAWKRSNIISRLLVIGTYQQIPMWMATSGGIFAIRAQKSIQVRSSPVCHAEE